MHRSKSLFFISFLAFAYLLVRLVGIDIIVTTDEPFWLGRSANFYRAIRSGDFVHTYQMAHPGVMTMWAGALAYLIKFPEYASLSPGNLDDVYSIERVLRNMGKDPLDMMIAARVSKILMQTIFFALSLHLLRKITGNSVTIITGLLISFSPFLSGYDTALHVDGLFTIICFTAILAIFIASGLHRSAHTIHSSALAFLPWIGAGVLSAMAILTRATGLVLIGVVGLALLIQVIETSQKGNQWLTHLGRALLQGLVWLVALLGSTFLLLPALWVEPSSTLRKLWSWSSNAATEGHENPTFFRGIHTGNPGWDVYPVVLAWRTSPVEWIGFGLLLGLGWWGWRHRTVLTPPVIRLLIVIGVFALVYIAAMSVGAKKFDRYILPAFPVIALIASIGIVLLYEWMKTRSLPSARAVGLGMTTLLLLGQAVSLASVAPYRLDFYNPILGGPTKAQYVLQMGWGQGGNQVVNFLNEQVTEGSITIQTSAVRSAFTYFLPDDTLIHFANFGLGTPAGWYETDYYVAGIQQTQRNMAPAYNVLRDYPRAFTVEIGGVPYFEVFNVRNLPLPESLMTPTACNYRFGEHLQLMQIIGRDSTIDLYFLALTNASDQPVSLTIALTAPDGSLITEKVTSTPSPVGTMMKVTIPNPAAETGVPLQDLEIRISTTQDGTSLPVTAPWLTSPTTSAVTQSECYYTAPPQ